MMTLLKILSSTTIVLALNLITHGKEWRGIMPLHSTRADVERLIGPPTNECHNNICQYKSNKEVVTVFYSDGPLCDGSFQGAWMVSRDTLIHLNVVEVYDPEKGGVPFRDLGVDTSKYKEESGGHVPGVSSFTNEEEGVRYELGTVLRYVTRNGRRKLEEQRGVVRGVTYMPAAKDKPLRCPEMPSPAPNNGMQRTRTQRFSYHQRIVRAADAGR